MNSWKDRLECGLGRAVWHASLAVVLLSSLSATAEPANPSEETSLEPIAPIRAPFPMPQLQRPVFPDRMFDIRDFGAVGDGKTKSTKPIAKAVAACAEAGGGRVVIPPGTWLTGAIHLKSNIDLHLAKGAVLRFSTDPEDYLPVVFTRWAGFECYNYSPLIYARACENIAVTGPGEIDGQGKAWWPWAKGQLATAYKMYEEQVLEGVPPEKRVYGTPEAGMRPQLISPIHCKNVHIWIEDVTMENIRREAIRISMHYKAWFASNGGKPPTFRNIRIRNVTCKSAGTAANIVGLAERPIENLSFENVSLRADSGIFCEYVNGLELIDLEMQAKSGPAMRLEHCENVRSE